MSTLTTGANPDLGIPISWSLQQCGYGVVNLVSPTDADIALVLATDQLKFLDLGIYRTLKNALQRFTQVTDKQDDVQINWTDLATRMREAIEMKLTELKQLYGYTVSVPQAGTIDLDFAETDPCFL